MIYQIVKTSNYNLDLYDEEFVTGLPIFTDFAAADRVADAINGAIGLNSEQFYTVVEQGYVLNTSDPN